MTAAKRDGMFDLPDYPSNRKVASSKHVSTRSVAWIASMSLHRDSLGHATDCAEYAEGSPRSAAAMPAAAPVLLGALRTWHDR